MNKLQTKLHALRLKSCTLNFTDGTALISKMNNDIKNKRPERKKKYEIKKLSIKRSNKKKKTKQKTKTYLFFGHQTKAQHR